jgi:hypothetical protein
MDSVTLEEIARYRSALAENDAAMEALDILEDCEGDLEDAAITLALQAGQEPDTSDQWLEGFAKRWRAVLCTSDVRGLLDESSLGRGVQSFSREAGIPGGLASLVAIYVLKFGVEPFCKPLEEKLDRV